MPGTLVEQRSQKTRTLNILKIVAAAHRGLESAAPPPQTGVVLRVLGQLLGFLWVGELAGWDVYRSPPSSTVENDGGVVLFLQHHTQTSSLPVRSGGGIS